MRSTNVIRSAAAALAGVAATLLAVTADAAVITTFTSRADFETAIGNPQTFDFNQPDGPISSLGTQLTISTVGGDATGRVLNNALCGSSGGGVDCFPPVLFTFSQPGSAFGYDNLDFTANEEAVVTFSFVNGDADQSFVFDLAGAAVFTPIFFGATSDVDISTVQIFSRDPGSSLIGQRANVIDNVTVRAASVPGPASALLLALGLAAVRLRRAG